LFISEFVDPDRKESPLRRYLESVSVVREIYKLHMYFLWEKEKSLVRC